MDKDPDRAARVYRRNRRIIWGTVAGVVIVAAYFLAGVVDLLVSWWKDPHLID
jgi:hypothetical protein